MAQSSLFPLRKQALFGASETRAPSHDDIHLADRLSARLAEKYRNYERAAARLEMTGETDAAKVLRQAAGRLRLIRNTDPLQTKCA